MSQIIPRASFRLSGTWLCGMIRHDGRHHDDEGRRPIKRLAAFVATLALAGWWLATWTSAQPLVQSRARITTDPALPGSAAEAAPLRPSCSASALALTPDGGTLLAVNPDSHTVTLVDTASQAVLAELAVGRRPRTVAVDAAGRLAVVANQDSGDVTLVAIASAQVVGSVQVGRGAVSAVLTGDGALAFVTLKDEDAVALVDVAQRKVVARLAVEPKPYGLALLTDDDTLLVTHLLSGRTSVVELRTRPVLYLPLLLTGGNVGASRQASAGLAPSPWRLALARVIPSWPDSNLSQRVILSPDGQRAYLPQTRSNAANRALTFDTTVFPIVAVLDLEAGQMLARSNIALDTADRPVGVPAAAALSADGRRLWVTNSASNDVSVVDTVSRNGLAHIEVGAFPEGIALSPDGQRAYVNNTLDGTVSVLDAQRYRVISEIVITEIPLPPALLNGKRLFHSSATEQLAREQWISCHTCHFEGEQDGRTWFFGFAGPRNTTSLLGMVATYPLRWSGEWDESADAEFAIRREQFGLGLIQGEMHPTLGAPNQGRSYDLDCLALYMDGLALPPSPHPLDAVAQRGQAVFEREDTQCAACHPAPLYTDLRAHDVGTATVDERIGPAYDTPTLNGVWATAPYLHDGSAATLRDVLVARNPDDRHGVTSQLSEGEIAALIAYMRALPATK